MNRLQRIIERDVCLQMENGATFLDHGYSGRGMFNKKCVAISGSMMQCQRTLAQTVFVLHDLLLEEVISISDEQHRLNEQTRLGQEFYGDTLKLMNFRTDNWGHDIVMYWPEIDYEEPAEADEGN